MAHAATVDTAPTSPIPSVIIRVFKYVFIAAVALLGLRFFIKDAVPYMIDFTSEQYTRFWDVRWWLVAHITGGTVALLIGPFQFWSGLRRRHLRVHKLSGKLYLGGVGLGSAMSIYLAITTPVGAGYSFALLMLAAAWLTTSGMALMMILRRMIDLHKEWMIRSYVVTFAFVTFRWWDDMAFTERIFGDDATVALLWACWVIPLGVTEVILQLHTANKAARKRAKAAA